MSPLLINTKQQNYIDNENIIFNKSINQKGYNKSSKPICKII